MADGQEHVSRGQPDDLFGPPEPIAQERMVEAVLFASAEPLRPAEIAARLPEGADVARALASLAERYRDRGVRLVRVGQAWAFRTAPDLGFLMRREMTEVRKLSRAGIETLAIIAYHQPVTRAEIEDIRGVAVSRGTLDLLLELDWIRLGKRRETPGRPATFVTTEGFLDHFGLASARDLPGLAELRAAGLVDAAQARSAGPSPEGAGSADDGEGATPGDDRSPAGDLFDGTAGSG